jgi:hypothetical protein
MEIEMSIEDAGEVSASGGRWRKVQWDNKTGEILVQQKGGTFSAGSITRIGIYTKNRAEAAVFAQQWLESNTDK